MINAIGSSLPLTSALPRSAEPSTTSSQDAGQGFGALLDQLIGQTGQSVRAGEAAAVNAASGTANPQEVVGKVLSAEQSLQIAIGVRDRIVNAYSEISHMTI